MIGQSYVAIFDSQRMIGDHGFFYLLAPGDRFDLTTRQARRPTRAFQPVGPREPGGWPQC